jgi:hypothetical protein
MAAPPFREVGNMLVLTRKTNEAVMIGDDVEVVVLSVQGNRVRLGITAPRSVSILRSGGSNEPPLASGIRQLAAEFELCVG